MKSAALGLMVMALALTVTSPASAPRPGPAGPDAASGSWLPPVAAPLRVLRDYRAPLSPYSRGHRGVDLHAEAGAPVYAPAARVVHFAGWVVDRPVLSIDHGLGLVSSFEPVAAEVGIGDEVTPGQRIGVVTDGAHCMLDCLHVGLRQYGLYVSPLTQFGAVPRAVLLPVR